MGVIFSDEKTGKGNSNNDWGWIGHQPDTKFA